MSRGSAKLTEFQMKMEKGHVGFVIVAIFFFKFYGVFKFKFFF